MNKANIFGIAEWLVILLFWSPVLLFKGDVFLFVYPVCFFASLFLIASRIALVRNGNLLNAVDKVRVFLLLITAYFALSGMFRIG